MSEFQFNLNRLLKSLNEIKEVSYREIEVETFGKFFTLGILSSENYQQVHEYCAKFSNKITFTLAYQTEVLAHALKAIDNEYFGNISSIPTGEYNNQDQPIKEQKHVFLRKVINSWNPKLRDFLFDSYSSFEKDFNNQLDKSIEFIEEKEEIVPTHEDNYEEPKIKPLNDKNIKPPPPDNGSFNTIDVEDHIRLYDENGNLTAEGRAYVNLLEKIKNNSLPPGIEIKNADEEQEVLNEINNETSTEDHSEDLSDEEIMKRLANHLKLKPREQLVKSKPTVENMTHLTTQHKSNNSQEAYESFQKLKDQNPIKKQPIPSKPFSKVNKDNLPPAERLRLEIEEQRLAEERRAHTVRDDDIHLTSKSAPLQGQPPIKMTGRKR